VLDTTLCDKDCQWLAAGWWFSPGTPVSSTNRTDHHDIAEILLKVALNTITLTPNPTTIRLRPRQPLKAYVVIQKYNEKYSVLILITQDAPGISDCHLILWTIANVLLYESEFIDQ
jgi:hypothetical protein